METLCWIVGSGLAMSAISLVGSLTLLFSEQTLKRMLTLLVAFTAGALIGGAFLHMIPAAARKMPLDRLFVLLLTGFAVFFALEQFLHWHHCHRESLGCKKPLTYLILIGDGVNDVLALATDHVGVALDTLGSDVAIETRDAARAQVEQHGSMTA